MKIMIVYAPSQAEANAAANKLNSESGDTTYLPHVIRNFKAPVAGVAGAYMASPAPHVEKAYRKAGMVVKSPLAGSPEAEQPNSGKKKGKSGDAASI